MCMFYIIAALLFPINTDFLANLILGSYFLIHIYGVSKYKKEKFRLEIKNCFIDEPRFTNRIPLQRYGNPERNKNIKR